MPPRRRRVPALALFGATAVLLLATAQFAGADEFTEFEQPHVHPLELSPDGSKLYALQSADARLVVFDLSGPSPVREASIPVGLEPVTVRLRNAHEAWVVSRIGDHVSIVDLDRRLVKQTLQVGDEPTDVVFAGNPERAFVCVSRAARLEVFDPLALDAAPLLVPLAMVEPRSLAVGADGAHVYVGALESGNQTTVIPQKLVKGAGGPPPAHPQMKHGLPIPPAVALIVKWIGGHWLDESGKEWDASVPYQVLDNDVGEVSVATATVTRYFSGAGTAIFNLAINPVSGRIYASNQEASNQVRFEPNVRGRFAQSRVTTIDPGTGVIAARHLNEHIDYANPDGNPAERAASLAFPLDLAVASAGDRVYVAAMGSRKIGVLDGDGVLVDRIPVGQGPTAVALDEARHRLYVLERFFNQLGVVDLSNSSFAEQSLGFEPTLPLLADGRRLFYDGENSSAHGDLACATCHLFGDKDGLAWDLGNPVGDFLPPPVPGLNGFHPMKGPMMTQALKRLHNTGPLHWRGDRTELFEFNGAFVSLQGRAAPLDDAEFERFSIFIDGLQYAPNPYRMLDGSFPAVGPNGGSPSSGEQIFHRPNTTQLASCSDCHAGEVGTNGQIFDLIAIGGDAQQDFKIPQLRALYTKAGFTPHETVSSRGFGYTHDGTVASIFRFLKGPRFTLEDGERRDLEAFLLCFDTGTAPGMGQQRTLTRPDDSSQNAELEALSEVANLGLCGLMAKGQTATGELRGFAYLGDYSWVSDRESDGVFYLYDIVNQVGPGREMTFSSVVRDQAIRLGVDHDQDGFRDRDELDAGSDPDDPTSVPLRPSSGVSGVPTHLLPLRLEPAAPNPAAGRETRIAYTVPAAGAVSLRIFDAQGREVRRLLDEVLPSEGTRVARWDLCDDRGLRVPAGVYYARLESAGRVDGGRIVVR